jgi:uncharacterized protein YraI
MPSRLEIGEMGAVTPGPSNNVRSDPGLGNRRLGAIPGEGVFLVLDGPVCAEDTAWWQVDYEGLVGWTAEGEGDMYWLEPVR